jgi:glycosyltransferase involved in cell wall biosynthesis
VYLLVEELVRMGHEVTLCASGDSKTSAELDACYHRALRGADDLEDKFPYSIQHAAFSVRNAGDYDIVHNHAGHEVMALSHLVRGAPMLSTLHCLITPDTQFIWDRYAGYYNTISEAQLRGMPRTNGGTFAGVVHNAVDVKSFPFQQEKGEHLLFLSRISPEKGPEAAVEVAKRSGRRLIVAGKVDDADRVYFDTKIRPLFDGEQVRFVGEADARTKRELYRHAAAVLMPIRWEEPFGLVLAEAQACGTPVITFNRGAAPEIVVDGESGFVVDTVDEMVDAVGRLKEIDPEKCRRNVERRFDAPIMARNYLAAYRRILGFEQSSDLEPAGAGDKVGAGGNGHKETTQVA